ncbi:MAG: type 1 glutamine amidotransferase [Pseudomonadota bacterium]
MRLLVFQHSAGEPPAAFGAHAAAAGDQIEIIRLFAGDSIPDTSTYDALLVMGGPMDVSGIESPAWLVPEKAAIRAWVTSGRPYLGICLGHQLLADAMGGKCARMLAPEIAVSDVVLTAAVHHGICADLPPQFAAMHWHGVEVATLPQGATVLGHSNGCGNQILCIGPRAWGLQFHPEIEPGTITQWMRDPANVACARDWLGSEAAAWAFVEEAEAQAAQFVVRSQAIYRAFRAMV